MRSRTRRNYFGTENPVKKMGDILPEIMEDLRGKRGDCQEDVFQFWKALIGKKMAPLTEPVSFYDGVLTVKVKSSTLYSLLAVHEKPRLLKGLQEKFSVRNLVFRVG